MKRLLSLQIKCALCLTLDTNASAEQPQPTGCPGVQFDLRVSLRESENPLELDIPQAEDKSTTIPRAREDDTDNKVRAPQNDDDAESTDRDDEDIAECLLRLRSMLDEQYATKTSQKQPTHIEDSIPDKCPVSPIYAATIPSSFSHIPTYAESSTSQYHGLLTQELPEWMRSPWTEPTLPKWPAPQM